MVRALGLAALFFVVPSVGAGQATGRLHIKIVLNGAAQEATPVPRHLLLVSDNPASAPPRRIFTGPDGTVDLRLAPGNYTVESDRPVAFEGKSYQWTQMVDVAAGGDAVLELTPANAEVGALTDPTKPEAAPLAPDPASVLLQWQNSVVTLWTPTTRASGFVIDAKGLIATSQRVVSSASSVEVQLSPTVKVAGSVLVSDAARDVAIFRINPEVIASVRPVPARCGPPEKPPLVDGQEVFSIDAAGGSKRVTSGTVGVDRNTLVSDFGLAPGSTGGPVFTADGGLVGITSLVDEEETRRSRDSRIVRINDACAVVSAAEEAMKHAAPLEVTHLPVEPARPFPVNALEAAAQRGVGQVKPYRMSSSDFEITFITPVLANGAGHQSDRASGRERGTGGPASDAEQLFGDPLADFGNWSDYVADTPPVLLVRATPKLVEGFWTTVARGAARTQGVSLPPIKHVKSGFVRMRAFCGDAEVTPIHPFTIERRVSQSDTISEGLYVFDPDALGPPCGTVRFILYSTKEPEKGDTRTVDPKVIEQVWQDFGPYRAPH